MFDKLSDHLNLLMTEAQLSADELARRTGLPASTIKKIRNRYNPNPTLSTLLPLAQYFSVSLDELVGTMPLRPSAKEKEETLHRLPLITWQQATMWSSENTSGTFVISEHLYSKQAFALAVIESGWENLPIGTLLLIEPQIEPVHRDFVIVIKRGQPLATLKQWVVDDGNRYLKPLIAGYPITAVTIDHQLLGVVREYKKQLKFDYDMA